MEDIKKQLGLRIKELRLSKSLTQEALAEKINISAKSLSQIELGNNFVSAETLNDLCNALNITPKNLFDFNYIDLKETDAIDEISCRLKNNPNLLKQIYKIVIAASELSKNKTGALIAIERDIKLKDIIDTGVILNAEISPQLLVNIFNPRTPLHDGAVIISENKIMAAACMLPLSDDKNISKGLGTRHRSALGMSKESDSVVVVVSEETGKISVAKDGILIADVKEDTLKQILIKNIITKKYGEESMKNKKDKKTIFKKKSIKIAEKRRVKIEKY